MGLKELVEMIPEPPADLVDWLKAKGCFQRNYLVFRCGWEYEPLTDRSERCFDVFCSACGEHFKAARLEDAEDCEGCHSGYGGGLYSKYRGMVGESVIQDGNETTCPFCGVKVICVHVSRMVYDFESAAFPLVISKVGENIVAVCYRVTRTVSKTDVTPIKIEKNEAYIFTKKKNYRLAAYDSTGFGNKHFENKWDLRAKCTDAIGSINPKYIYYTKKNVFHGTPFENCKFGKYLQGTHSKRPIKYLMTFKWRPQIENLIVQGFGELVDEYIESCNQHGSFRSASVDWNEVSPRKMLGLSKPDFDLLKGCKTGSEQLLKFRKVRESNAVMTSQEILDLIKGFGYRLDNLIGFGPKMQKMARYFIKQSKIAGRCETPRGAFTTWEDYLRMAKNFGYDLNNESLYMPPKLHAAHDRLVAAVKYNKQQELIEKFNTMYKKLLPLSFEKDGLLILPAASEDDLINEGKALNHCVGGYGQTHCEGNSIFFIRHADKPDKPFYTLQLHVKDKFIMQNHGKNNIAPTKDVETFCEYWLEHVVKAGEKQDIRIAVNAA